MRSVRSPGVEGVLECEAGNDRVQVLLNLLGRDVSVRVPAGFVVPSLAMPQADAC